MNHLTGFQCSICGQWHSELPLDFGADRPDLASGIPSSERESRVVENDDFVVIDGQYFFVRGTIEIPILGYEKPFSWGVWVSLSEKSFKRMVELLESPDREKEPAYFGWLSTNLPYPEPTLNLKTMVHTQPFGRRPIIEVEPTSHPLAVEQQQGITIEQVRQIAERLLHA